MALDTNWFRTGDRYISLRDGSDSTLDGTVQATPHATIEDAITTGTSGDYIIRSGVYAPAPTGDLDIVNKNLKGDSENVYIVNNATALNNIVATTGNNLIDSVNIFGVLNIFEENTNQSANNIIKNSTIKSATTVGIKAISSDRVEKNLFKGIARIKLHVAQSNDQNKFTNNTFINCQNLQGDNTDAGTYVRCYFEDCNFIESDRLKRTTIENITFQECVFNNSCNFFGTLISEILSQDNSTLTGTKSPDGTTAESTDGSVNKGSFTYSFDTPSGNPRVATFQNCFWIDKTVTNPFNDDSPNIQDYTLKAAANGGTQSILYDNGIVIGKYGLSYKPTIDATTFSVVSGDATIGTGSITLNTGNEAVVKSADIGSGNHIQLPSAVLLTDAIRFFGSGYSFPNAPIAVFGESGQLVDQDIYDSGDANPNVRYTFWLKYKDPDNGNIMPNNNQTANAADWYEIEQGNISGVEIDNAGKGNGDVEVSIANLTPIRAKEFQVRITLRNDAN